MTKGLKRTTLGHISHADAEYALFQATQFSNVTPLPPKRSKALPNVKSTLPPLLVLMRSRSCRLRPPPAYVTGIEHHPANLDTSSSSIPFWRPSLSAAWIRNSEQYGSSIVIDSLCSSQRLRRGEAKTNMLRTFSNLHLRNGLPFVHSNKPGSFLLSTA
jgi:hypothetical protein